MNPKIITHAEIRPLHIYLSFSSVFPQSLSNHSCFVQTYAPHSAQISELPDHSLVLPSCLCSTMSQLFQLGTPTCPQLRQICGSFCSVMVVDIVSIICPYRKGGPYAQNERVGTETIARNRKGPLLSASSDLWPQWSRCWISSNMMRHPIVTNLLWSRFRRRTH